MLLLYAGRKQFPALLERLLEFTQRVEGTLSATEAPDQAAVSVHVGQDEPYLNLAESYPEAAVLQAFREVEEVLRDEYQRLHPTGKRHPLRSMFMALRNSEAIDPSTEQLFKKLRDLRNTAVHERPRVITPGEAIEYRRLCQEFLNAMRAGFAKLKR